MPYLAVIGDMIQSRHAQDRSDVQKKLATVLDGINHDCGPGKAFGDCLISKFTITLGDEFQALLRPTRAIFHILDTISWKMEPSEFRYGMGVGDISTSIDPDKSIGADGPAYWFAREAIKYIHDNDDYGVNHLAFRCGEKDLVPWLNDALACTEFVKSKWNVTQRDVFHRLLDDHLYDEQFEQKALAARMNLKPSPLQKRLKTSGLRIYLRTRTDLGIVIEKLDGAHGN
ncbi:MAG: SatD family protein [Candidatus Cryosericum sp.]